MQLLLVSKYFFLLLLLLSFSPVQGRGKNDDNDNNNNSHDYPLKRTNICLNMIVKNEAHVIERLIQSVKDYIDYYVIVDTGSTDGTQELIKNTMNQYHIQGEVHDREWVDFAVNRQQALDLAVLGCPNKTTEWALIIDADDEFVVEDVKFYDKLKSGTSYGYNIHHVGHIDFRPYFPNIAVSKWEWRYPMHEQLFHISGPYSLEVLRGAYVKYNNFEGGRSQGMTLEEKALKDIEVLEAYLLDHPTDKHPQYMVGQLYHTAGHLEKAMEAYQKRALLGGLDQFHWYSHLNSGKIAVQLDLPEEIIVKEYLDAFTVYPNRVNPLYSLSNYFRTKQNWGKAYIFAQAGAGIDFYEAWAGADTNKSWKMLDELCIVAFYVGQMEAGRLACEKTIELVVQNNGLLVLDEATVARVKTNLEFYPAPVASEEALLSCNLDEA